MDKVSAEKRSMNMRRIHSRNTRPEMAVRKLVYSMGYRYRLHGYKDLPGKPDLVFPGRKKVISIHGCFWHQHEGCKKSHVPKSRMEYWAVKLQRNRARDLATVEQLQALGWRVLILWECEIAAKAGVREKIEWFLSIE